MGCGSSRAAYEISQAESDLFRELRLSKSEVQTLLSAFSDIDLDGSGMIRMDELFGTCRIEETNCNKKIFGIFDCDGGGTLNFSEFVCAMWMFLALSDTDLALFIYNLFDSDHSGALDVTEIKNIIATVHHKLLNGRNAINRLLEELVKRNHRMTSDEFVSWTKANPSLLEPIFHLHLDLRNQLVGNHFWQTLQTRRYASGNQTNPQYIDLIQKRLQKISRELEKKGISSKSKKKIHPTTAGNNNNEEREGKRSIEKKQKTNEKNTSIIIETEKLGISGKRSNVDEVAAALAAGEGSNINTTTNKPRKKSNVGLPDHEENKPRKKSNVGLESEDLKPRKKSNVGLEEGGDPQGDQKKHHHHHHGHHRKDKDKDKDKEKDKESDKSHGGTHHHHNHHHHGNETSHAPSPARPHLKESRTTSL